MKVKDAIGHLKTMNQSAEIALDVWNVEDVLGRAEQLEVNLSIEECESVLYAMEQGFDANIGLSWDVMDVYIADIMEESWNLKGGINA